MLAFLCKSVESFQEDNDFEPIQVMAQLLAGNYQIPLQLKTIQFEKIIKENGSLFQGSYLSEIQPKLKKLGNNLDASLNVESLIIGFLLEDYDDEIRLQVEKELRFKIREIFDSLCSALLQLIDKHQIFTNVSTVLGFRDTEIKDAFQAFKKDRTLTSFFKKLKVDLSPISKAITIIQSILLDIGQPFMTILEKIEISQATATTILLDIQELSQNAEIGIKDFQKLIDDVSGNYIELTSFIKKVCNPVMQLVVRVLDFSQVSIEERATALEGILRWIPRSDKTLKDIKDAFHPIFDMFGELNLDANILDLEPFEWLEEIADVLEDFKDGEFKISDIIASKYNITTQTITEIGEKVVAFSNGTLPIVSLFMSGELDNLYQKYILQPLFMLSTPSTKFIDFINIVINFIVKNEASVTKVRNIISNFISVMNDPNATLGDEIISIINELENEYNKKDYDAEDIKKAKCLLSDIGCSDDSEKRYELSIFLSAVKWLLTLIVGDKVENSFIRSVQQLVSNYAIVLTKDFFTLHDLISPLLINDNSSLSQFTVIFESFFKNMAIAEDNVELSLKEVLSSVQIGNFSFSEFFNRIFALQPTSTRNDIQDCFASKATLSLLLGESLFEQFASMFTQSFFESVLIPLASPTATIQDAFSSIPFLRTTHLNEASTPSIIIAEQADPETSTLHIDRLAEAAGILDTTTLKKTLTIVGSSISMNNFNADSFELLIQPVKEAAIANTVPYSENNKGLTPLAIGLIVAAACLVVVAIIALIIIIVRRKANQNNEQCAA